jgi:electron transfer flavoprotein alpha subunit
MTVRPTNFDPAGDSDSVAEVVDSEAAPAQTLSTFVSHALSKSDRPSLAAADTVVAGGRGLKSGENFGMLNTMADKLNAAVGASRAAVDAGYVPNDYQIGQTGKIVAPVRASSLLSPPTMPISHVFLCGDRYSRVLNLALI